MHRAGSPTFHRKALLVLGTSVLLLITAWVSPAMAQRPLGLDVSAWQGDISQECWNQIYAAGKRFAIIRVTHYGVANGDPDDEYSDNIQRATAAGLLVSPYHYAIWSRTPQVEANYFLQYAAPYITAGYLPPMLDLESKDNPGSPVGATSVCDWARQWLTAVKAATGVDAMVYMSGGNINAYGKAPSGCSCGGSCTCCLVNYPLHDADWCGSNVCTACGDINTAEPEYGIGFWPKWTFWQYCSTGSVSCITGNIDLDVFNGTMAELQAMVIGGGPPVISNVQSTGVTNNTATITWTTNIAADSQVQYGTTTSYGNTTPLNPTEVTAHSVNLSGLFAKTLYHYRVLSTANGTTTYSSDYTFTTDGPPVISNVQAGNITTSGATITWTTDARSTSQVNYGLTSSYGSQTALDSNKVNSHSVVLSGLQANTTYHYQALSTNSYPPNAQSADFTFTTLPVPPVISNVQAGNIGDTSATITWNTNVGSSSQVEYGTSTGYGQTTTLDSTLVTAHSVNLTGLFVGTLYHYRVISSVAGSSTTSGDFTFTTTGTPAGPVISNVAAGNWAYATASTLKADITWTTNVPADTQVQYGLTPSYGSSSTLNPALVTSHTVTLSGLSFNTTYHYRVRSASAGGTTYSNDYSVYPMVIDNTDTACTKSGTWTSGTVAALKIGGNYLYKAGSSTGTATVTWTPDIPASGPYDVYVFYQMGTNRNTAAAFKVVYNGGTLDTTQNQYHSLPDQGGWFKLNTSPLQFAAGTAGYAQVSNNSTDTKNVSADAALFVFVGTADTQAPTVPGSVTATAASTTSIQLNWAASSDNVAVTGYKIYRGGAYLASSATNSYTDMDLTPNTSYSYEISAYDAVPNESARSSSVTRATLSVPPSTSTVTCDRLVNTWYPSSTFVFTAVGGFGAGRITKYKYAWDQSATHSWMGSETDWSSGTRGCSAGANGNWYMHLRGYNSEGVANGTADLGPYKFDGTAPTTPAVVDDGATTFNLSSLHASWSAADPETGITRFEYRLRYDNFTIRDWTDAGGATEAIASGLALTLGHSYVFDVRATNGVGAVSTVGSSDGILVFMYDADNDGMLELSDWDAFIGCLSGPTLQYPAGGPLDCGRVDTDFDQDVDVDDFGQFQRCLSGLSLIDPACLE